MPIYKRNNGIWYIDITTEGGRRIRQSAGTKIREEAQQLHDKLAYELWQQQHLGRKPERLWEEAAVRWINEKGEQKKSIGDDISRLRQLTALRGKALSSLDRRFIMQAVENLPCGNSTKNRYIALIRAILNKAAKEWDWIDTVPTLTSYREPKKRVRWLKPVEAQRLLDALSAYPLLHDLAAFSLATGLRQRNVLDLKWEQVDLNRRTAWVNADQAKSGQAITVPLNQTALQVLFNQVRRSAYVFTKPNGQKLNGISSKVWKSCLKTAGITDFRWHDLRHTWASWLIQRGVPVAVLKEMGGWENAKMVERYAHLSSEHLLQHADVLDTIWTQPNSRPIKRKSLNTCLGLGNVAPRPGLEPGTCGLTVRRSTD